MRFLADENFNHDIVSGLLRRSTQLDLLTVQDAGIRGQPDPAVLEWASAERRIVLTHDIRTMPRFALERILAKRPMTGLIVAPKRVSIGAAIADLLLISGCTEPDEWQDKILYLPL